jgi:hypothetical protein
MIHQRRLIGLAVLSAAVLSLTACASTGVTVSTVGDSEQLAPVNGGNVQTGALPPIGPNGEVQGPNTASVPPGGTIPPLTNPDGTQVAATNPSTTTLPGPGALPNSSGRDLTGGLTVEKLLGRWTVISGTDQCQLNLTQTAKSGTSRYRASAPACVLKSMTGVASWTLAGSQVQLFDESGNIVAALILSGNRFIGTLSGGQGISMTG